MSNLILVRHGQATFGGDDYDNLSATGELQARRLGDFWGERRVVFDEVFTGPRKRQRHTAEIVREACTGAGLEWPEPVVIDELDEYNADGIVSGLVPLLVRQDERIRSLVEAAEQHRHGPERNRHFQRMFEAVMGAWIGGTEAENLESWRSFHDRVRRGIARVTAAEASGRRVVVFTSGGPISVAVQTATQAPEHMAVELNWRVRNCSLTEIIYTRDRFTLDVFNAVPHLGDSALLTYR
ncbi:MAG TPA: histidine phosphatase family protein [Blastocatellia bacterium]|nr:histidine phosphatase family protein [Blastocatellia bacterium]